MSYVSVEDIKKLDVACNELSNEIKIGPVGVIDNLGKLIAGGFKMGMSPLLDHDKVAMTYM